MGIILYVQITCLKKKKTLRMDQKGRMLNIIEEIADDREQDARGKQRGTLDFWDSSSAVSKPCLLGKEREISYF